MNEPLHIAEVPYAEAAPLLDGLCALLADSVDGGASIGFLAPLGWQEARRYWLDVFDQLRGGGLLLWVARQGGVVVGTVQLAPAGRANGRNRAEVQKLMVSPRWRGQGTARLLMLALEARAQGLGRGMLHLDTEAGSGAEGFYAALGYRRVGEIPDFAASPDGTLRPTAIYYKLLIDRSVEPATAAAVEEE